MNRNPVLVADEFIVRRLENALNRSTEVIERLGKRVEELELEREKNRLMTEEEAMAYLKRDISTLQYYRQLGLDSYKKGGSRWYTKGEIDRW